MAKTLIILLAFTLCGFSSALSESYDLVGLVGHYADHVSLSESLRSVASEEREILNGITDILPKDLNKRLVQLFFQLASYKCFRDMKYVMDGLETRSEWALKMLDSFGKPESGILLGNLKWVGEYDECLGIRVPPPPGAVGDGFRGRYCTLQIPLNFNNATLPLSTAVCLPDSCNPNGTIASILENAFKDLHYENVTSDDLKESVFGNMTLSCKPTERKLTAGAISFIFFLSLFALLALIGSSMTVFEYYTKSDEAIDSDKPSVNGDSGISKKGSVEDLIPRTQRQTTLPAFLEKSRDFFNCFCVFTNGEKILNVASSEGQLPSLHGIRFLSMSWVILCHSYAFCGMITRNISETIQFVDHWFLQIILNGFYSVDSFFLLSGFLVGYLFFQQCAKTNGKIPWAYFYIHRYIRLTPVYAIVIMFYLFLNPFLGDGPIWPEGDYDKNCKTGWWWNLLYINNFQTAADMCLGWSWYLANDMQFYVISPIFLITLWRWPRVGYALIGIGLFATFATNLTITVVYESFTGLGNIVEAASNLKAFLVRWTDFFDKIYTKPYTRIGPYLIGLSLAYYLYKWKQNNPKKLKLSTLAAGWAVASAITLSCLFGLYHQKLTTVEAAFYNGLNRIGFAMGLSWVVFVCVIGQGDVVGSLLSWKVWIPLSRLTFCAYLVHPIVQNGYYYSARRLIEFSHITVILFYLGFLILAYSAALVTTLLFESPVIRLEKYVRNKFASR